MYPEGCKGNHSFFQESDLKRHYRIVHAGISSSGRLMAEYGPSTALHRVSGSNATPGIMDTSSYRPGPASHPSITSAAKSASRSIIRSHSSTTIVSSKPTRLTQHALESMQSFHSAVSRQPSLREEELNQRPMQIDIDGANEVLQSVDNHPQDTAYGSWRREMIEIAIKHFRMTSESAEAWVLTLQAPTTGAHAGKVLESSNSAQRRYIAGSYLMADEIRTSKSKKAPSSADLMAQSLTTGPKRERNRARNAFDSRHTINSRRENEYFVPQDGIDREVITADICRYLGNDSIVRPGNYENPQTRQIQQGYFITAYRNLTTAMIADLKADSARWQAERRQMASQGQLENVQAASSDRQYYRPVGSFSEIPRTSTYAAGSSYPGNRIPSGSSQPAAGYSQPAGYPVQDNYYVAGADLYIPAVVPSAQVVYAEPQDPYYGRAHHNMQLPSSTIAKATVLTTSDSRSSQLWWLAYFQLQYRNQTISEILLNRWQVAVRPAQTYSTVHINPALIEQKAANLQADSLLAVLALSDDISLSPGDIEKQLDDLSTEALNSVFTISNIIKIVKSSFDFRVGAFVWTLFCVALEEVKVSFHYYLQSNFEPWALLTNPQIVKADQQNSKTRSDHILPHMAEIASLIARYNVMENIYIGSPNMTLDSTLQDSLLEMSVLVLLYIYTLMEYHISYESTREEDKALGELDRYIGEIKAADYSCRQFTIRIFDGALADLPCSSDEEEDWEDEDNEGHDTLKARKKIKMS
jgi:hypothetical protein